MLQHLSLAPFAPFGLAVWIAVFAGLLGPGEALRADTFSVGTSGTCSHDDLPGAIAAAAATAGSDTIRIVDPPAFTGPLTLIDESPVTLAGTLSCTSSTPQSRALTIAGTALGFQITGTALELRNLTVTHSAGVAAVIAVDAGIATLVGSTLQGGGDFFGGNVRLGTGGSIQLLSGSVIRDGEATFDGGGIYCTGGGTIWVYAGCGVRENLAARGGGIFLDGCTLELSAGGPASAALAPNDAEAGAPAPEDHADPYWGIWHNEATTGGGGVYARGGADIVAAGASFRENRTNGANGAGLYLTGNGTSATLTDSEMVRNLVVGGGQGGAAFVTSQATLLVERSSAPCEAGYRCSLLDTNQSLTGALNLGGTLKVQGGGKATIRQTMITGALANHGGGVALVEGSGSEIRFEGVMFTGNGSGPLVWARDGGKADLRYVSVAENNLGGGLGGFVKSDEGGDVTLLSSVVIESPGEYVFGFASIPGAAFVDCLLTHDFTLIDDTIWYAADPSGVFTDPAAGDLRLRWASAAIDHCDDYYAEPVDTDIELQVRGVDVPTVPGVLGYNDLGADEWYPIFVDGFNSGNSTAWSSTTGGG